MDDSIDATTSTASLLVWSGLVWYRLVSSWKSYRIVSLTSVSCLLFWSEDFESAIRDAVPGKKELKNRKVEMKQSVKV